MAHYGVARMTARNAMRLLQDEGLVTAEHGKGSTSERGRRCAAWLRTGSRSGTARKARPLSSQRPTRPPRNPAVDMIEVQPESSHRRRDHLGCGETPSALIRSRRYLLDGTPVRSRLLHPGRPGRGTPISDPNPGPGGIYARLEEPGHILERFTEEVTARMPTPDEVRVLALPPGVPVFRLVRTAYDTDERAVEVCDTIMAADAYLLAYELPAHWP